MTRLDVQQAAAFTAGLVVGTVGASDPAARWIAALPILEVAFEHQDLFAARVAMVFGSRARCEPDQSDALGTECVQRQHGDPRRISRYEFAAASVDHDVRAVMRVELMKFDEDRAALIASGNVAAANRVAYIRARRVVAILVREDALEYEELLTASV